MSEHKRSKPELNALADAPACLREPTRLEAELTGIAATDIYRVIAELITDKPHRDRSRVRSHGLIDDRSYRRTQPSRYQVSALSDLPLKPLITYRRVQGTASKRRTQRIGHPRGSPDAALGERLDTRPSSFARSAQCNAKRELLSVC